MTDTITREQAVALALTFGIEESALFGTGDIENLCKAAIQHYIDQQAALAAPQPEPQPVKQDPLAQTCGVCGYTGNNPDSLGQCPRCHWDELVPTVGNGLRSALNAMLTQFGMDEDEWNKPTFDQARAALAAPPKDLFVDMIAEHGLEFGEDMPEPQPVKQESWITAARLVVEATPEQLPLAIDALRDLIEGSKQ